MRRAGWSGILALLLMLPPGASAQEGVEFFPAEEIRPGMKGVGRTIFQGDKIEEFEVEFLGVLKNALAPKHDVILARISGGPLEKTGVIAGMSGSPVYVDGRLVGAVALSFPFSKEPLAGITPIQGMVDVVPGPAAPPAEEGRSDRLRWPGAARESAGGWLIEPRIARVPGAPGEFRLIPEAMDEDFWSRMIPAGAGASENLAGLKFPLRFGGFTSEAVEAYAPLFRRLGFEPMSASTLAAGEGAEPVPSDLEPGSMISLLLVRGDLNLNVDCTVTFRQGDQLYACGHRFLLTGPAKIPFAPARVVTLVPSLASSFKLSSPGAVAGSIRQDRFGAIYGVVGEKAPQIPVRIRLNSTLNRQAEYRFEVVQEPFLSPLLLNLAMVSTLSATERMIGPSTLELKGRIRLAGGETVDIDEVVSADTNTGNVAGLAVAQPLTYLLAGSFPDLRVDSIDLEIVSRNEKRQATIEQVWSSKSEVRPGDRIELTAVLRTPSGERVVEKIPVEIPESLTDKTLSVVIGSGSALNMLQPHFALLTSTPRDLRQLVRALNRMRRGNRLYALLMSPQRSFVLHGDEYPSPPPSLVQTFLADPSVASGMVLSGMSLVGDFETPPAPFAIRGYKTLLLRVASPGS
jgi:hypothetical protein